MIISIGAGKLSAKIQHPLKIKQRNKLSTQGIYFKIINATYDNPTADTPW